MVITQSKLDKRGRISVPAEVKRRLGLTPGSQLEWFEAENGSIHVKRAGDFTFEDIHRAVFDTPSESATVEEMDSSVAEMFLESFS